MKSRVPPPIYFLLAGGIMWFIAHSDYAIAIDVRYSIVIAALIGTVALAINIAAVWQFHVASTTINPLRPEKASTLVRTGVFSKSRNPMYLGMLLFLVAWMVGLNSVSNAVVVFLFYFVITEWQIKPEETALRGLFGEEFDEYCRTTGRWI